MCDSPVQQKQVNEVDVELEEVQKTSGKKTVKASKRQITAEIKATNGKLEELDKLRRKYGYHPKWTNRMVSIYSWMGWN